MRPPQRKKRRGPYLPTPPASRNSIYTSALIHTPTFTLPFTSLDSPSQPFVLLRTEYYMFTRGTPTRQFKNAPALREDRADKCSVVMSRGGSSATSRVALLAQNFAIVCSYDFNLQCVVVRNKTILYKYPAGTRQTPPPTPLQEGIIPSFGGGFHSCTINAWRHTILDTSKRYKANRSVETPTRVDESMTYE